MGVLIRTVRASVTPSSQLCSGCGVLVADFHQWFTQECGNNLDEGHQTRDWVALPFDPETIAKEYHSQVQR